MLNKDKYRLLCKEEKTIPIFSQDWWLDLVCGNNWDVCLLERDGKVLATMPYFVKNKFIFRYLTMPLLTQKLGPWIRPEEITYGKKISRQMEYMSSLIQMLPNYDYFIQNWDYSQTNHLPFFWKGFDASIRYTYVIDDLSNLNKIFQNFKNNIKSDIRKANEKYKIKVISDVSLDSFIDLNQKTFLRQGMSLPYSIDFLKFLLQNLKKKNQCKWFVGQDKYKNNHAGVLIIWDQESAYYLVGGGDPNLRSSGATSLCMWEAIKFSSTVTKKFDFEGSMIKSVEKFFRGFGATQKTYYQLRHIQSKILKTLLFIMNK